MKNLIYRLKKRISTFNNQKKTIVIILSSMRSGSTLIKALLAEAPDVSHLQEVDYRWHYSVDKGFKKRIYGLSNKRIIVLKYPYGFHDVDKPWPVLKGKNVKVIVLIRDPYAVVKSLEEHCRHTDLNYLTKNDFVTYWHKSYQSILNLVDSSDVERCFVRYEDLIKEPKKITKNLFRFIGSKMKKGIESYHKPKTFEWRWGFDDGSEVIRKLRVQKPTGNSKKDDIELLNIIDNSKEAYRLCEEFGYIDKINVTEKLSSHLIN